jgi:hypothetical protein
MHQPDKPVAPRIPHKGTAVPTAAPGLHRPDNVVVDVSWTKPDVEGHAGRRATLKLRVLAFTSNQCGWFFVCDPKPMKHIR